MKRSRKKSIAIICIISVTLVTGLISFFKFGGYFIIDKADRDKYITEIKNSSELPYRFYEIYNVIFPNALGTSSWKHTVNTQLKKDYKSICPCQEATYTGLYPLYYKTSEMTLLTTLTERYVSQKECLNYYASKIDFANNAIGIQEASFGYFKKDISDLDDSEFVELILIMQNPYFYTRNRSKDEFRTRINEILKKINNP